MQLILNAVINRKWHYAETWTDKLVLIDEAMEHLEAESRSPHWSPGDDACFMFSDRRHDDGSDTPNNFLKVAVNSSTGFGALIWFVSEDHPSRGGVFDHTWVSDNPNHPNFDPRVIADPGEPRFHDPKSALEILKVREALEEFCRAGTGDRPESILWVRGYMNGYRLGEVSH
ncbi:Imm1 family immunity protein [Streptomyces xanthophaeus]|uniref:Imm1 family immunity protein n=1 Tax=Streptomyces xanthophaeus TaxID=67385 RepID=UPI00233F7373|nr:Imm1 family immunity protein [Streptomyces xanthophaeus]